MRDDKGIDNKILAVPLKDPLYQHVNDIHDIAPHLLTEIENFFLTYKKLEAKVVATEGWADSKKTMEYLTKTKVC